MDSGQDCRTADLPSSFAGANADGAIAATAHHGPDTHGTSGHAHPEVCMTGTTATSDVSARGMRRITERAWLGWKASRTSLDVS